MSRSQDDARPAPTDFASNNNAAPPAADDAIRLLTQRLRQELETRLDGVRSRWFAELCVVADDGATITLGVPNLFIREWIERRYLEVLAVAVDAMMATTGAGARKIELAVDGRLYQRFRAAEAAFLDETARTTIAERGDGVGPLIVADAAGATPLAMPSRSPSTPRPAAPPSRNGMPGRVSASDVNGSAGGAVHSAHGRASEDRELLPGLDDRLTLERFVVGECNDKAYRASLEVLSSPGAAYNPLFIHGASGVGKTHLLQGITRRFFVQGQRSMRFLDCERFSNLFVRALRERSIDAFRKHFHGLRVLVLDDIQVLVTRMRTQAELLHAIDAIISFGGQVIFASDTSPHRLEALPKQLQSRLLSGLVTRIEPPDYTTRKAILEAEMSRVRVAVAPAIQEWIARRYHKNVRELIGAMVRVVAYASLLNEPLTIERVESILEETAPSERGGVMLETISGEAAGLFGVSSADLTSRARGRAVSSARQMAIYLARTLTDCSLGELGRYFGDRNHATVNFAFRQALTRLEADPDLRRQVEQLVARLKRR